MNVSVVVTHYNHNHYLLSALESIALQSVQPMEVIVIDDGSRVAPRLPAIRDTIGIRDISVIYAPHRGVGAALNTAIGVMRGDVFCWLPSDDIWKPQKLERQQRFSKKHPDCVLHSWCDVWQDGEFSHVGRVPELSDQEFKKRIRTSSPYYASTFWIPRWVLDRVGPFRENVPASEDYQWVLRSVIRHGIRYRLQKESLAIKYRHAGTLTSKNADKIPQLVEQFNREI